MTSAEFSSRLGEALLHPTPAQAVRQLLREALLARERGTVQYHAYEHSWWFVERLDAIGDSDSRLLEASRAVHRLLRTASSERSIEMLREVVVESARLHQVLARHLDGRVSRTQLLSFLAEQSWGPDVKAALSRLSHTELEHLRDATGINDIAMLEQLLQR